MAIDPMLYRKVSGKSGDPAARLGQALAQGDSARAQREVTKDVNSVRFTTPSEDIRGTMLGLAVVVISIGLVALVSWLFM
jgi:hypothetical protein